MAIGGGYAEVLDDVMTVLADSAEFAGEIDAERALRAKDKAEGMLKELDRDDKGFAVAEASLHRALVRLQVAAKEARR
jgi:F-type H+-transporting ATPase subunit epsilon